MPLFVPIEFEVDEKSSPNYCYKPTKFETSSSKGGSSMSDFSEFVGYSIDSVAGLAEFLFKLFSPKDPISWELIGVKTSDEKIPMLVRELEAAAGKQYVYSIPPGLSITDIEAKQEKIENILKHKVSIELAANFEIIITELSKHYEKVYSVNLHENALHGAVYVLGRNIAGKEITLDLSGNELHTLICGSTGSGKSVCLNLLMVQFILKGIQTRVVDLKGGVEFAAYRNYKNMAHMAITEEDAVETLESTVNLMNKRYKELFDKGYKSYKDCKSMKPVVLLIDEYNALMNNKEAQKLLFALLSRARAANIIVILATQRPSHEVLPGMLKANIKNFIVFKCENQTDSEIALSEKGNYRAFTELKSSGEALLKTGGIIQGFKGYYLTDSEIDDYIKPYLTKKSMIGEYTRQQHKVSTPQKDDIKALKELI